MRINKFLAESGACSRREADAWIAAGRKGKGVTVVTGLPLAGEELEALATRLKKRCGTGGTVRDGVIEIQGDHRDTLVAELEKLGYAPKRSGG